jgi:hypothetical protein
MAFADPQSVTVNTVAQSMPRISTSGKQSVYQKADGTYTLTLSHQGSKVAGKDRIRSMARIDNKAIVADPLTAVNDYDTLSCYVVIDRPVYGFDTTATHNLVAGFIAWLTNATVDKLFGQET